MKNYKLTPLYSNKAQVTLGDLVVFTGTTEECEVKVSELNTQHNKEIISPEEIAFNKAYFVNLFADDKKYPDFWTAKQAYPRLAAIAEQMQPSELKYLIDKIESLL